MKCKGFAQICNLFCSYELMKDSSPPVLELVFWEDNSKILSLSKIIHYDEGLCEQGIIINEIICGKNTTIFLERIRLFQKRDDVNIEFFYKEKNFYNDVSEANASIANALYSALHHNFVKKPEEMNDAAKRQIECFLRNLVSHLSNSECFGPSFNNSIDKVLKISHVLLDDKLDEIIADAMKVQTVATHIQTYLEDINEGKCWYEDFQNPNGNCVRGTCDHKTSYKKSRDANSSNCSTKTEDTCDHQDDSTACSEDNISLDNEARNEHSKIGTSHHSGDTCRYHPVKRFTESVNSQSSSFATYRFNPKSNRFEISALPSNSEKCQPLEILPKMTYGYCERKVKNIYKLVCRREPPPSDLVHYSNMMKRQEITTHDLVCILQAKD